MAPSVYRPYPRRLQILTICRCHYKGGTFSSVIQRKLSVGQAGVLILQPPVQWSHACIKVGQEKVKITQYADDTTAFLSDLDNDNDNEFVWL